MRHFSRGASPPDCASRAPLSERAYRMACVASNGLLSLSICFHTRPSAQLSAENAALRCPLAPWQADGVSHHLMGRGLALSLPYLDNRVCQQGRGTVRRPPSRATATRSKQPTSQMAHFRFHLTMARRPGTVRSFGSWGFVEEHTRFAFCLCFRPLSFQPEGVSTEVIPLQCQSRCRRRTPGSALSGRRQFANPRHRCAGRGSAQTFGRLSGR